MRAYYFLLVQQMLQQHGRPLALYHDRHSIFKQTSKATEADTLEEQLAGKQDPTQFGRLLEEWEITSIAARSPQAKGRVERLFGTLPERLLVQLRLAETRTLEQANQVLTSYLPRFNAQFAVAATQVGNAYRPLQETLQALLHVSTDGGGGQYHQFRPRSACNCCLMRIVKAMPKRASRSMSTLMGICQSTLQDAVSQRLKHRWRLPRCALAQGLGVEPKCRRLPRPQAQPWKLE
jgi:hypothetical protein